MSFRHEEISQDEESLRNLEQNKIFFFMLYQKLESSQEERKKKRENELFILLFDQLKRSD